VICDLRGNERQQTSAVEKILSIENVEQVYVTDSVSKHEILLWLAGISKLLSNIPYK